MSQEMCGNCQFHDNYQGCRRYPPTVNQDAAPPGATGSGGAPANYPQVRFSDWCGEYQEKPQQVAGNS